MVDEPATGGGAEREAERGRDTEQRDREPDPATWGGRAKRGEHHAGVSELEANQEQPKCGFPPVLREPKDSEDHHLDEGAAGDDRNAAIALRPDSPKRYERKAKQEERCVQVPGPG